MSAARETPLFAWQITRFPSEQAARGYIAHSNVEASGSGSVALLVVTGPKAARKLHWTLHATVGDAKAFRDQLREDHVHGVIL